MHSRQQNWVGWTLCTKLLKVISKPLAIFFENLWRLGMSQIIGKNTNIVPIFMKEKEDYTQISLTSIPGKIIKSTV